MESSREQSAAAGIPAAIVGFGVASVLFCLAARVTIALRGYEQALDSLTALRTVAGIVLDEFSADLTTIAIVTMLCAVVALLFGSVGRRIAVGVAVVAQLVICLAAFVSIETYRYFGSPLTYPLIHYSDVFDSAAARGSIGSYIPRVYGRGSTGRSSRVSDCWRVPRTAHSARETGEAGDRLRRGGPGDRFVTAPRQASDERCRTASGERRRQLADVVWTPARLDVAAPDAWLSMECEEAGPAPAEPAVFHVQPAGPVRNVIVVVMESVSAKYP